MNFETATFQPHFQPSMIPFEDHLPNDSLKVVELPITQVFSNPNQPRKNFEEQGLEELGESIKNYGIIQPILVQQDEPFHYTIIAGERRWRAAQRVGLSTIPCLITQIEEQKSKELALIENIQRRDLSPVEEARAYQDLIDTYHYTQEALAEKLGKDRSTIANLLRILHLPEPALEALDSRAISLGHAKLLCPLETELIQLQVLDTILFKKLSVRQTEQFIQSLKNKKPAKLEDELPSDLRLLVEQLKGHLGTKVKIAGSREKGTIEITYYSMEDLERIGDLVLGGDLFSRAKD